MLLIGFLPSFLKKFYYRIKGHKIGKKVSIGFGSVIIGREVIVEDHVQIGHLVTIRGDKISIGRFVSIGTMSMIDTTTIIIGEDTRINVNVTIGGLALPESLIQIGKRCIIMPYNFLNPTKPIVLGDDCAIGGHSQLFTHASWLSELQGFPVTFEPITIGDKVYLAWNIFVLPGAKIGNEVVIGAKSLVRGEIPSNTMAAGSPAKVIKENYPTRLDAQEKKDVLIKILNEFEEHLSFHGYQVKVENTAKNKRIQVTKGRKNYVFDFVDKEVSEFSVSSVDLLVLDVNVKLENSSKAKMIIDIPNLTRTGTSDVGEEFARYLSRFGIRCERLD